MNDKGRTFYTVLMNEASLINKQVFKLNVTLKCPVVDPAAHIKTEKETDETSCCAYSLFSSFFLEK